MKAAQLTTAATPAKKNVPFFNKESGHDFFHSSINGQPFFSKTKNNYSGIQTKLTIGKPNDIYEKEADSMADKVVQRLGENKSEPTHTNGNAVQRKLIGTAISPLQGGVKVGVQTKCATCEQEEKLQKKEEVDDKDLLKDKVQKEPIFESNAEPSDDDKSIQRECTNCEKEGKLQEKEEVNDKDLLKDKLQKKPIFESNAEPSDDDSLSFGEGRGEALQRKCTDCEKEEKLQKKSDSSAQAASPGIESSLSSSKGSGSPIQIDTREQMENSFGADFSGVRIHNDSSSVQMNKDLHAQAFTHGSDIYFNSGKYNTNSNSGRHLLAHELTHVVQQKGTISKKIQKQDAPPEHLTKLNEMLDRFDVPEEEVIDLLRQLTPAEKTTVNSDVTYRIKIAAAFNISEMVRAVIILNPTLIQKLEWVEAAAGSAADIDYPDISFLIISSSQPERDTLKTIRWRDFFVNVCDNSTIITAVTNLHFDLKTQLEWIEEEASPSNIEYSQIQSLINAATQPDRDVLKTNRWRDFFVGVCTNKTIITAVTDLRFDLKTQLEWIEEEASPKNIEYSEIKPLIISASQPDRDVLKTIRWRDFFVGVCDNDTIIDAVTDLNFDIKTKLEWLMEEGTHYSGFKKLLLAASAADKATILADTAFLMILKDYFSTWNNFAKTVELLGRVIPNAGSLLVDPTVLAALSSAWAVTGASITTPGVPAPPGVHEEGGYIYMNIITGSISTSRAAPGARASLPLNDPDPPDNAITVGGFHTHPNVGPGWGAPFASPEDIDWSTRNGIPLLIRGAFPTVASVSDTSTGSARLHLAGDRDFPGRSGGEAPQASLDGLYDEV